MIRETELGSNSPKLLASFRIKMARSSASLILVPDEEMQRALLLRALPLRVNDRTWGSVWRLLVHQLLGAQIILLFSK